MQLLVELKDEMASNIQDSEEWSKIGEKILKVTPNL
jgi:hypothetical protein